MLCGYGPRPPLRLIVLSFALDGQHQQFAAAVNKACQVVNLGLLLSVTKVGRRRGESTEPHWPDHEGHVLASALRVATSPL